MHKFIEIERDSKKGLIGEKEITLKAASEINSLKDILMLQKDIFQNSISLYNRHELSTLIVITEEKLKIDTRDLDFNTRIEFKKKYQLYFFKFLEEENIQYLKRKFKEKTNYLFIDKKYEEVESLIEDLIKGYA